MYFAFLYALVVFMPPLYHRVNHGVILAELDVVLVVKLYAVLLLLIAFVLLLFSYVVHIYGAVKVYEYGCVPYALPALFDTVAIAVTSSTFRFLAVIPL